MHELITLQVVKFKIIRLKDIVIAILTGHLHPDLFEQLDEVVHV